MTPTEQSRHLETPTKIYEHFKARQKKKYLFLYTTLHTIKTLAVLPSKAKQVDYNCFTDVQQRVAQVRVQNVVRGQLFNGI